MRKIDLHLFRPLRRHPLVYFYALACGMNIAILLVHRMVVPLPRIPMAVAQAATPTISAMLVAAALNGKQGVHEVLAGFMRLKVNWHWYLAAFLMTGIPLLIALVYLGSGHLPRGLKPDASVATFFSALALCLFSGPLPEEAGWRGFALPYLQKRYNALVSSLILGLLWAFWHIPFFLDPVYRAATMPFAMFVGVVIGLSILFTWIFNNSGGSLFLTVLAHFFFNVSSVILVQFLGWMPPLWLYVGGGSLMALLTLWVVFFFGPKNLSRRLKPAGVSVRMQMDGLVQ